MTASPEKSSYEQLVTKLKTITNPEHVESVLNYDRMVFMPM